MFATCSTAEVSCSSSFSISDGGSECPITWIGTGLVEDHMLCSALALCSDEKECLCNADFVSLVIRGGLKLEFRFWLVLSSFS